MTINLIGLIALVEHTGKYESFAFHPNDLQAGDPKSSVWDMTLSTLRVRSQGQFYYRPKTKEAL